MNKYKLAISISALILGCAFSGVAASASFQSCTGTGYNIADNVTPTTNCTMLLPLNANDNDVPQPGFVNTAAFFGKSDWLFDEKFDNLIDSSNLFDFSGTAQSGTFTKVGTWSYSDVMFIFKDGAGTNLVGYLINTAVAIGGIYNSPFEQSAFPNASGNNTKDISHISVYYRNTSNGGGGGTGGQVPEPGVVALMGIGLLGMGASRIRKAKA